MKTIKTNSGFAGFLVLLLAFAVQQACAYYDPDVQRWLNRDPLGHPYISDGASGQLQDSFLPFEFYNGGNLYHFVRNYPTGQFDAEGLDIWIIRDKCGIWGHEWVVGSTAGGGFWDSSKYPGKGLLAPANCSADIQYNPKSGFDPTKPDKCIEIIRHVKTTPEVDETVRAEAEKRAREDKGRYDALCSNCRSYAAQLGRLAGWHMLNIGKIGRD